MPSKTIKSKNPNRIKAKKQRIDSVAGQIEIAKYAAEEIKVPEDLNRKMTKADKLNFQEIISEAPKADWVGWPHRIRLAAALAMAMSDYFTDLFLLRKEGPTIMGAKGPMANPRKAQVAASATFINGFRRSLAIHGRALNGDQKDNVKRLNKGRAIESQLDDDDDLLASPMSVN